MPGKWHHRAKLTLEQVTEIRARYVAGGGDQRRGGTDGISQQQLAKEYGVSQGAISQILGYWTWRTDPDPSPKEE